MVYTHIFFDYGGLLAHCICTKETNMRAHEKAKEYLETNEINISLENITASFSKAIEAYREARKTLREWTLHEIIRRTFPEIPSALLDPLCTVYKLHDHDSELYDDIGLVIPVLSVEHVLGIVSDCPHDSLRHELAQAYMLKYFHTTTMSCEVGYRKPHPAIYQESLEKTGALAKNSLFVSHEQKDLDGAKNVGIDTLQVDRDNGEGLHKIFDVIT